jgi:hypothetical protein
MTPRHSPTDAFIRTANPAFIPPFAGTVHGVSAGRVLNKKFNFLRRI